MDLFGKYSQTPITVAPSVFGTFPKIDSNIMDIVSKNTNMQQSQMPMGLGEKKN